MTRPPAEGGAVPGPADPCVSAPPGAGAPDRLPNGTAPKEWKGAPAAARPAGVPGLPPSTSVSSFEEGTVFVRDGGGGGRPWKEEAESCGSATGERAADRLRSLMEATRDVVYMLEPDGTIKLLSKSFEKLTGWPCEEWVGKKFAPLIHPDDLALAESTLARLQRGEMTAPHEMRLARADGTYLDVEFFSSPVAWNGKVVEIVGSGRDMRERREVECERANAREQRRAKEEAEAANRAKDEFLAALSHELRTPLTPVLTLATALEDEDGMPWPCHDAMRIVRRNVELEARLIDDLLDLTRIIRGKLHLRFEVVDVHRLLREVVDICEDDLRGKRLNVVLGLDATETVVRADSARLEQVFWNLIKNAVKFTPEGGTVWVTTSNAAGGGRVTVSVRDNGVGISAEAMGKIFEAFEQGGEAVTRRYGGLGLGLAIGKGIVDALGGRIAARSPGVGQGATFEVELNTVPGAGEASAVPTARRSVRSIRILLVEDHADTARVMEALLEGRGHRVERTARVAAALEVVRREPFDVMISDLGLPDGSGWDLMREVKKIRPEIRGIALSGYGMETDLQRSREAGFEHHVVKPFNFATLTALIQRMAGEGEGGPGPESSDLGE